MSNRRNLLTQQLRDGDVVHGASMFLHSPTVVETLGSLGLDYVFVDLEHSGPSAWDAPTLEGLTRAAELADIDLLVRLPSGDPETHPPLIRKVIDASVRNVVIPRVETADEVRQAVAATQFAYEDSPGGRGVGAARASSWGADLTDDWFNREDRAVACGIMIENRSAVDAIDDILAVPGLAFVLIGSMDLSVSLGRPGDTDHPEFHAAIEAVTAACNSADVPFGQMGVPPETASRLVDSGAQLVEVGNDVGAIRTLLGEQFENVRDT